jgi:PAS domain S-box-containing protein
VELLVVAAYPIGDAVLLFGLVVIALRRSDAKIRGAIALLMLGILATAVGDLGYSYLTLKHTYKGGDWPDVFYMLSFFLIAFSAQYQWWSAGKGSAMLPAESRRPLFSLLPYVSIATVYAVLLWDESFESGADQGINTLILGALIITAVVVVRQIIDVRENTRLLAEREAQKSELRFRALVQHSSDVITILDSDTTIRYQSPALTAVFGYQQGQLIGKRLIELVHPDDVSNVVKFFDETSRDGHLTNPGEWRLRHQNGAWRHVENIGTNLLGEPMIDGIVINTRDITERKIAVQQIQYLHHQNKLILDSAGEGVFGMDPLGNATFVNPAAARMLGVEPHQLVGQGVHHLIHHTRSDGTHYPADDCPGRSTLRDGTCHRVSDEWFWKKDGTSFPVEYSSSPVFEHGKIVGAVVTFNDITERKRAETERADLLARIQEQRQQLNNVITNVPGIVWETWVQGDQGLRRNDYVSEYAEKLLGYSVDDEWLAVPNFWLQIVHPDDKAQASAEAAAIFKGGKGGTSQFRWLAKDGRVLWVEVHMLVICDGSGNPIGLRGVTMDITKRKEAELSRARLEHQLREAQRLESIGTLAGGIAHDFNNILSAIIGYAELAGDDLPAQSAVQAYLAQVLKASYRAKELVDQILTFSRQQEQERKPINCQIVLDEALNLLRASLPSTIEIRREIDPQLPLMLGDPGRIHQIVLNLATNAMHAMRECGGILEVRLAPLKIDSEFAQTHEGLHEGNYLRLIVSDTGCGMDKRTQERIFEPFFTTKAPGEGTGLGLAMVYGIVKDHNGAISVYSEPGKGTTFNVYFPVHQDLKLATATQSDGVPKGRGQRVLFVDDEEPLAVLGKQRLERLGYEVSMHTSSIEALQDFRTRPDQFDLLISDYTMPDMNGADLAKHVLKARCDMPVILVTGYSSTINPDIAASIGIRELLMKPMTAQIIGDAVHRVLAE